LYTEAVLDILRVRYFILFSAMERKKQLLIKVLTKLKPHRNLAEGILALVESSYVDEKTIDGVLLIINQSIKNVKNQQEKMQLEKSMEAIKKIQQKEDQDKESIESLLDNI